MPSPWAAVDFLDRHFDHAMLGYPCVHLAQAVDPGFVDPCLHGKPAGLPAARTHARHNSTEIENILA
jgi:hypothetical protein